MWSSGCECGGNNNKELWAESRLRGFVGIKLGRCLTTEGRPGTCGACLSVGTGGGVDCMQLDKLYLFQRPFNMRRTSAYDLVLSGRGSRTLQQRPELNPGAGRTFNAWYDAGPVGYPFCGLLKPPAVVPSGSRVIVFATGSGWRYHIYDLEPVTAAAQASLQRGSSNSFAALLSHNVRCLQSCLCCAVVQLTVVEWDGQEYKCKSYCRRMTGFVA